MRKYLVVLIAFGLLACNKNLSNELGQVSGNYLVNSSDGYSKKFHSIQYKNSYPYYVVYSFNSSYTKASIFSAKLNEDLSIGEFNLVYADSIKAGYDVTFTITDSPCEAVGTTFSIDFDTTNFKEFSEKYSKVTQYQVEKYVQTKTCL